MGSAISNPNCKGVTSTDTHGCVAEFDKKRVDKVAAHAYTTQVVQKTDSQYFVVLNGLRTILQIFSKTFKKSIDIVKSLW